MNTDGSGNDRQEFRQSLEFYTQKLGFTVLYSRTEPNFAHLYQDIMHVMLEEYGDDTHKIFTKILTELSSSRRRLCRGRMNLEVLWSSVWPNKRMVLTLPALRSFGMRARHKRLGAGVGLVLPVRAQAGRTCEAFGVNKRMVGGIH